MNSVSPAPSGRSVARRTALALPALLVTQCAGSTEATSDGGSQLSAAQVDVAQSGAASGGALRGALTQGGFVTGRVTPGTRVGLDGRAVPVSPDGTFALGFGRDAGPTATLAITAPGERTTLQYLSIVPREWDVQRINGLPERQVTPDPAGLARIRAEQVRLDAARRVEGATPHYARGLLWPARGRISGVYGSQRILNGQPRSPHLGLDVAGPVGTPIVAAAAGRVTLAGDLYFTGNTLLVEHGQGVTTLYAHLSRIMVAEGQEVARGERIADMGATGRVTGPHLHLGMFWSSVSLDPRPVLVEG